MFNNPQTTNKYLNTFNRLVAAGYPSDRALACIYVSFGLTPDQLAVLQRAVEERKVG